MTSPTASDIISLGELHVSKLTDQATSELLLSDGHVLRLVCILLFTLKVMRRSKSCFVQSMDHLCWTFLSSPCHIHMTISDIRRCQFWNPPLGAPSHTPGGAAAWVSGLFLCEVNLFSLSPTDSSNPFTLKLCFSTSSHLWETRWPPQSPGLFLMVYFHVSLHLPKLEDIETWNCLSEASGVTVHQSGITNKVFDLSFCLWFWLAAGCCQNPK